MLVDILHLIGTADLIAQMADRCYLEKCRDRLYKEFVVGGVAIENAKPGEYMVRYKSGLDLLKKTPVFYQQVMRDRLHRKFRCSACKARPGKLQHLPLQGLYQ